MDLHEAGQAQSSVFIRPASKSVPGEPPMHPTSPSPARTRPARAASLRPENGDLGPSASAGAGGELRKDSANRFGGKRSGERSRTVAGAAV